MPTKLKARPAAAAVAGKNGHSIITSEKFRQLYAALVKYELLEQRLGSSSANTDGAAGAVGITLDLEREDTVVLSPRTFAANFIKGVPLRSLLDQQRNRSGGTSLIFGAVNAFNAADPSAVAQAGLAAGAALANKMAQKSKVAVAFIEGGATSLAECREALKLASENRLPVLYVMHATPDHKLERALAEAAELVPVITVDAGDVVAVYRVAQESLARARDGFACLIVCVSSHLNGTAESALSNMEHYLTGRKLFRNRWKVEAVTEFERELSAACHTPANPLA